MWANWGTVDLALQSALPQYKLPPMVDPLYHSVPDTTTPASSTQVLCHPCTSSAPLLNAAQSQYFATGNELICWGSSTLPIHPWEWVTQPQLAHTLNDQYSDSGGKLGINKDTLPFSVQLRTVAGHYKQVLCGSASACAISMGKWYPQQYSVPSGLGKE